MRLILFVLCFKKDDRHQPALAEKKQEREEKMYQARKRRWNIEQSILLNFFSRPFVLMLVQNE